MQVAIVKISTQMLQYLYSCESQFYMLWTHTIMIYCLSYRSTVSGLFLVPISDSFSEHLTYNKAFVSPDNRRQVNSCIYVDVQLW